MVIIALRTGLNEFYLVDRAEFLSRYLDTPYYDLDSLREDVERALGHFSTTPEDFARLLHLTVLLGTPLCAEDRLIGREPEGEVTKYLSNNDLINYFSWVLQRG